MDIRYNETAFSGVQAEINAERAAALGRLGKRALVSHEHCCAMFEMLEATDPEHELFEDRLEIYRASRVDLEESLHMFRVQRETAGVYDHRQVAEAYPAPPAR